MNDNTLTLRVLAHLLSYPDATLREHLGELRDALRTERALTFGRLAELDALFASRSRAHWTQVLGAADCCCEPVLEPHEVLGHPLHAGRDLLVESGGLRLLRALPALAPSAALPTRPAPSLGEHTDEVLRELGVDAAELSRLRAAAVVG